MTEHDQYVRNCHPRCPDGHGCIPWHSVKWGTTRTWDDVPAVRVLSEGVSDA